MITLTITTDNLENANKIINFAHGNNGMLDSMTGTEGVSSKNKPAGKRRAKPSDVFTYNDIDFIGANEWEDEICLAASEHNGEKFTRKEIRDCFQISSDSDRLNFGAAMLKLIAVGVLTHHVDG